MTNHNSRVSPPDALVSTWLGASCPRVGLLGTGVPAAGTGTGMSAVAAHAVPRIRSKAVVTPPQTAFGVAQLTHNYMTGVNASGEGASGPPRHREPV